MKILAGMTANRTHITAKGGPTHFSDALNKLILKAMNTTHKFMASKFGSNGAVRFRDTAGGGSAGTLTLFMLKVGGALPMVQIRAEKDGLHVFSWVENSESGEDYLNKLIGKVGWMDVRADDFEWSLDSALVGANKWWGSIITPNAKADISSFCGFVIKKYLKSNIKSSANPNLTAAKNFGGDAHILKMVQYSLKELEKMARTKNLQVDSISNNRNTLEAECVPADDPYSSDFSLTCELDSDYLTIYGNVGSKRNKLAYCENGDSDGIVSDLSYALHSVLKNETNRRRAEKAMDKFEEAVQDVLFGRYY